MATIKLKKDGLEGKAGEVIDTNSARARALVEDGQAEFFTREKGMKAQIKEKNEQAGPNAKKK